MTPREFVGILDEWGAAGGAFPQPIAYDYAITTAAEAEAVCRALATPHIYAVGGLEVPALNKLVAFSNRQRRRKRPMLSETKDSLCSGAY
jgi:hypothetical protein